MGRNGFGIQESTKEIEVDIGIKCGYWNEYIRTIERISLLFMFIIKYVYGKDSCVRLSYHQGTIARMDLADSAFLSLLDVRLQVYTANRWGSGMRVIITD